MQIVEREDEPDQIDKSVGKENDNSTPLPTIVSAVSQPLGNIQPKAFTNPSLSNPHLDKEVQHLAEHNKCLQHQVCKLKNELIKKANQFSCSCQTNPQAPKSGPMSRDGKFQPPKSCAKCKNHLCKTGAKVRFEEKLDFSTIHLCSHLACLQRQVCHLKMEVEQLSRRTGPEAGLAAGREKQKAAEAEIAKLEMKCDKLLDQKKIHLERISQLQKQLETLLKSPNIDSQVQGLILNIESQRDNYKYQVQQLIEDLKNDDRIIIVNHGQSGINKETSKEVMRTRQNVKRTIISEPRQAC